jgi:hypothetical protein
MWFPFPPVCATNRRVAPSAPGVRPTGSGPDGRPVGTLVCRSLLTRSLRFDAQRRKCRRGGALRSARALSGPDCSGGAPDGDQPRRPATARRRRGQARDLGEAARSGFGTVDLLEEATPTADRSCGRGPVRAGAGGAGAAPACAQPESSPPLPPRVTSHPPAQRWPGRRVHRSGHRPVYPPRAAATRPVLGRSATDPIRLGSGRPRGCASCDRYRSRVDSRTTSRVGRGVSGVGGSSSSRARRTFCIISSPSAAKSWRTVVRGGYR